MGQLISICQCLSFLIIGRNAYGPVNKIWFAYGGHFKTFPMTVAVLMWQDTGYIGFRGWARLGHWPRAYKHLMALLAELTSGSLVLLAVIAFWTW